MVKMKADKFRKERVEIGKQNLNAASLGLMDDRKKTIYVNMDLIDMRDDNDMSMDNVPWLKQDIAQHGLLQPLLIVPNDNGRFTLYGGYQRITAIRELRDEGKWPEDNLVECKLKDLDSGILAEKGVRAEIKEKYLMRSMNIQRDKTDADKYVEVMDWKEIYKELRARGIEAIAYGIDEEGNEIEQKIAGVKTQELIAQRVGISHAQVGKFEKIANKGSEELIGALKSGMIPVTTASKVASKPKEEQKEILERVAEDKRDGEVITEEELIAVEHRIKEEKGKKKAPSDDSEIKAQGNGPEAAAEELEQDNRMCISEKDFKRLLQKILKHLKGNEIYLENKEYGLMLKHLRDIERIIIGE